MTKTILIVDDDEVMLTILETHLRDWGYKTLKFNEPIGAVKFLIFNGAWIDLVVTDYDMPVASGLEFIEEIREIRDFPCIVHSSSERAAATPPDVPWVIKGNWQILEGRVAEQLILQDPLLN